MKSSPTVRVLIVDDHPVVRAGLRVIPEVDPGILVIGEAGSGAEAIVAVRESLPDVVLLDVRLPDRNGIDVCRELKSQSRVIRQILSVSFRSRNAAWFRRSPTERPTRKSPRC
jgi:two-component system response regulator DevR